MLPTNILTIHVKTLTVLFIVFEGLAKMHYLGISLVCLLINILIFLKRKNRYISHWKTYKLLSVLYLSAIFFYKLLKFLLECLELFVTQWQSIFVGSQNQFGYLSTVALSAKFPQHTRLSASLTDYLLVTSSSCCSILN